MEDFNLLQDRMPELCDLCKKYGVLKLWVFGSVAKGTMEPSSDIDFAIEFGSAPKGVSPLEQFFGFQREAETLFGHKVDLVEWSAAKNPFFRREVERTRKQLYAA